MSGVTAINSTGAKAWIMFLRSIPATTSYCFVNASPAFIYHCNMITDMQGRGEVVSFFARYECVKCGRERERLLQTSSVSQAVIEEPPRSSCGACGGVEEFVDKPHRYFAFLERSR